MPSVTSAFDGGSIDCVDAGRADDIRLALRPDAASGHLHWFYFRLTGARGLDCTLRLTNAADATRLPGRERLVGAWDGHRPVASYDRRHWFRVDGAYRDGSYVIRHRPERDAVYYAYFAPYPMERHADLVARALGSPAVRLEVPTRTPDGHDLDLLRIGEPAAGRRVCWLIARQHPSETMAGWFIEGLLDRLLDPGDAVARDLLARAVFYVVPNMNPDGARRGHTRSNALGADLNREWAAPSPERSPEVFHIRARMEATGVDFCLDVHGDDDLTYNFLGGPLEIPSRSARLAGLFRDYQAALAAASPDYQIGNPYPGGPPETADLRMAWNWIAERFDCLSMLLEQPFKDNLATADPIQGWSPERAAALGRATLEPIAALLERLR